MECNKEEAERAVELARKKSRTGDLDGMQRLINKALSMDPDVIMPDWITRDQPVSAESEEAKDLAEERFKAGDLCGAVTMIDKAIFLNPNNSRADAYYTIRRVAYSIHLAAASCKTASGGTDWYAVLGVDTSDDYATMLRRYRDQLNLTHHHGSKRGSAARDGAWELTRVAWTHVRKNFVPWKYGQPSTESNKEAARKAIVLAEERFEAGDYEGAMRLAGRAGLLDPDLPGTEELEAVYRVHFANANYKTADGETNWYAVLGVDPSLDFDTIDRLYSHGIRHLVHPCRSNSAATDGADLIASRAWLRIMEEKT